jgi:hypothetical protein
MGSGREPLAFMAYWRLDGKWGDVADWAAAIRRELAQYGGSFVVLQVGLSMATDPDPTGHFENQVAQGRMDSQIDAFLDAVEDLALPVYLRIGYEFNGTTWNGYQPASYQRAFTRIEQRIRGRDLEVATVWNYSSDGADNYMDFYPGDDAVDFWGINLFSADRITAPLSAQFVDDATVHGKPVMIGESTPRYVGVLGGQSSWDAWFAPYFAFVHALLHRPKLGELPRVGGLG